MGNTYQTRELGDGSVEDYKAPAPTPVVQPAQPAQPEVEPDAADPEQEDTPAPTGTSPKKARPSWLAGLFGEDSPFAWLADAGQKVMQGAPQWGQLAQQFSGGLGQGLGQLGGGGGGGAPDWGQIMAQFGGGKSQQQQQPQSQGGGSTIGGNVPSSGTGGFGQVSQSQNAWLGGLAQQLAQKQSGLQSLFGGGGFQPGGILPGSKTRF